jgi:PTH1 family peptidyl-tRNA hydrolase
MVAEALIERWGLGRVRERFRGRIAEGRIRAPRDSEPGSPRPPRVAVLCPQTYMNDAGRSVGPARGAYKLALDRVLVVHDEIDLPFGEVRARAGGGLAGHNGLKSIKRELGGGEFSRVRVGVGRPDSTDPEVVSAYVLGRFREDDSRVRELIERACEQVERVMLGAEIAAGADPAPARGPAGGRDAMAAEEPAPRPREGAGQDGS